MFYRSVIDQISIHEYVRCLVTIIDENSIFDKFRQITVAIAIVYSRDYSRNTFKAITNPNENNSNRI